MEIEEKSYLDVSMITMGISDFIEIINHYKSEGFESIEKSNIVFIKPKKTPQQDIKTPNININVRPTFNERTYLEKEELENENKRLKEELKKLNNVLSLAYRFSLQEDLQEFKSKFLGNMDWKKNL